MLKERSAVKDTFRLRHKVVSKKHILVVSPQYDNENEPVEIEITEKEWNKLRTGFTITLLSKTDKALSYIKKTSS